MLALVELLAKASFIQILQNHSIQLVIRSKTDDETSLGTLIELVLQEETKISSHHSHPFSMQKTKRPQERDFLEKVGTYTERI